MVPLVEQNVNLIELGPRQTGKTFLLRNVSPRVFTVSGGKTTPANLFVNLATRQVGILGTRKVVVFDEIAHTTLRRRERDDLDAQGLHGERPVQPRVAGASPPTPAWSSPATWTSRANTRTRDIAHLFEPLPDELIDSAFLDRVHGYLPGWEVPKITPASVATGVGFVTDYFGEVLVRLREESFADRVREVPLHAGMTSGDQMAVERIGSGLIKLLYPDGQIAGPELDELVTFACELRQRMHQQLSRWPPASSSRG